MGRDTIQGSNLKMCTSIVKPHYDSNNVCESLLVGLGPYTGCRTVLDIVGNQKKVHIKSQSLIFNGSEIEHWSEPFKGTRYILAFFN